MTIEELTKIVYEEVSENNALLYAHEINKIEYRYSYHNFRKSAKYCAKVLKEIGVEEVEVIPYPADGNTTYMDCVMPMAWDVKGAKLEIISHNNANPKVLADWDENPFTIGMWSPSSKSGGDEAEVVLEEDMWKGKDIHGKIVLNSITHHPRIIKREVAKRGGIGVVSDWTEEYLDTSDGIYWNNEWSQSIGGWYGGTKEDAEQSPIWCMSITPRTGSYLRSLISDRRTPVRLRATIDTRIYKDKLDVVTGIIPGKTKNAKEVLMMAHIYEPMPDDDAAGGAAVLEMIRSIKSLINKGKLLKPERTIRVLLMQECFGTMAYLSTHPDVRSRIISALYLDEPCFDQKISNLPVIIHLNTDVQASFTDVLLIDIVSHCFSTYGSWGQWKPICNMVTGTDMGISDPTIGIPVNWVAPQQAKGYHHNSNSCNFSLLDPDLFRLNMTINASFAYFVASAGMKEVSWLGSRIISEAKKRIKDEIDKQFLPCFLKNNPDNENLIKDINRKLNYLKSVETNRVFSLKNIIGQSSNFTVGKLSAEISDMILVEKRSTERQIKIFLPKYNKPTKITSRELISIERIAQNIIPERKAIGMPVQYANVPYEKREKVWRNQNRIALKWTDGKRNLLEIIHMVEDESGMPVTNIKNLISYFTSLAKYGYLKNKYKKIIYKDDIKKAFKRIGIKTGDVVFMHSSLSSAGYIEGGADTVINVLIEVVGKDGTIIMPTNYDDGVIAVTECGLGPDRPYPPAPPHIPIPWDPKETLTYTGAIPNVFWKRKDVFRSNHPTHSVAACGKLAKEFIEGHEPGTSACGRKGPYGKMVDYDGKFLYFCCPIQATTFFHALDDWANLPYIPTADVLMKQNGKIVTVKALKYPEGHRSFYTALDAPNKVFKKVEETGVEVKKIPFGFSNLKLVRAKDYYEKLFPVLQKESDLFLCDDKGCPFCTWARKQISKKIE